jgi:DNA-binding NtrC family response regulator
MQKAAVCVLEEDAELRRGLQIQLLRAGYRVSDFSDPAVLLAALARSSSTLFVIGSSERGRWDLLDLACRIRHLDGSAPVILIPRHSSEALAIAALRLRINDYFSVPFDWSDFLASVKRNLPVPADGRQAAHTEATVPDGTLVGDSAFMRGLPPYLRKVAATDCNVLITGETGTGKERVATLIHTYSRRSAKTFMCINCAALPDGLLEGELFGYERGAFTGALAPYEGKLKLADGGTVLLDEIGEMSPYGQAKILRAIESREVLRLGGRRSVPLDIRIIAATNQELEQLVDQAAFRKDLYFRLQVVRIHLLPLRSRSEDIPALLDYYVREANRRHQRDVRGFTEAAIDLLVRYDWPGNVRELKNMVEATFIEDPERWITPAGFPEFFRRRCGHASDASQDEKELLLDALFSTNWNKSKAAQKLHWSRMTLYRKIAKHRLSETNHMAQPARGGVTPPVRS